jgi:putative ABC transport system ATP-binding protein
VPERFLAVEDVSVSYGKGVSQCMALSTVSVEFEPAKLTLVKGHSGSGKTTLLSLLGCLLRPDRGEVYVNGQPVGRMRESQRTKVRRRSIGFVFQAFRLFHSLSALDNVAIAGEIAHVGSRGRAKALLEKLGLGSKLTLRPNELSGGEKQKVAIARALLRNPPIVLADEPTASLDSKSGSQISSILRNLADFEGRAVVVVSHDPRWEDLAHRTILLADGQIVSQS